VTGIIKTSEDVGACGAALDTGGGGTLDHVSLIGNTSEIVVGWPRTASVPTGER
jgi:hypothetical protein